MEESFRFLKAIQDLKRIYLTFGGEELSAPKLKPHEQDKNSIGRMLYDHLSAIVRESARPSLLTNIYDALSLKPGLFGISLDVKVLLESTYPDFKENLNKLRLKRREFAQLQIFVGPQGTKRLVSVDEARKALGEKLYTKLLGTGVMAVVGDDGRDCVVVHDLVAGIIGMYS
jgi:hypothetical protein